MAGRLAAGLRNLQTAAMDEISTAVFKATTDDLFEPKEKHVVAVARWSCEPELQEQVASALAKRVSTCGARPVTTAKTLFLLHRVATTGEPEAVLGPSVAELRSLVERRSLPAAELAYAPYIVGLCEWDDCNLFRRPDAPACWRGMPLPAVLEGLRPLQALAEQVFFCSPLPLHRRPHRRRRPSPLPPLAAAAPRRQPCHPSLQQRAPPAQTAKVAMTVHRRSSSPSTRAR